MLSALINGIEFLNGKFDPFDFKLDGWGEQFNENVTDYDENFLAIHGLNQFYEKTAKSGPSKGNVRPGADRPTMKAIKKGVEVEVPISEMSEYVEAAEATAIYRKKCKEKYFMEQKKYKLLHQKL